MSTSQQPCHTLPEEYVFEGMPMSESMTPRRTLELLMEGGGPSYEVLVSTYTRTGTARLMEVVWALLYDLDFETAKKVDSHRRYCFLELCDPTFTFITPSKLPVSQWTKLAKSHLNYHVLKKHVERDAKFIIGMRNPKDTLVSLYHFYCTNKAYGRFQGTFDEYFELVKAKHLAWGDFFDFYLSWWNERHRGNILFVSYEDFTENPVEEVQKIANFLGKDVSQSQVEAIARWTLFDNMRQEETLSYNAFTGNLFEKRDTYMRKGKIGDWKNAMTQEQSDFIDREYAKRCVPEGLTFKFE